MAAAKAAMAAAAAEAAAARQKRMRLDAEVCVWVYAGVFVCVMSKIMLIFCLLFNK